MVVIYKDVEKCLHITEIVDAVVYNKLKVNGCDDMNVPVLCCTTKQGKSLTFVFEAGTEQTYIARLALQLADEKELYLTNTTVRYMAYTNIDYFNYGDVKRFATCK